MKKILFATTALVATASVAAADVSFSGYARFGVGYLENRTVTTQVFPASPGADGIWGTADDQAAVTNTAADDEWKLISRLRVQIDASAESDGGIKFMARYRIQGEEAGVAGINGARFGVSYGGLTMYAGNIIGAFENMANLYLPTASADTGLEGNGFMSVIGNTAAKGFFTWDAYSSAGAGVNGVEAIYSMNGFQGHLSLSEDQVAGHLQYEINGVTVAIAGVDDDSNNNNDKTAITIGYDAGDWKVAGGYADNDGTGKWNLQGLIKVGAATEVYAWVADEDTSGVDTVYGAGVAHSLGGGVSIEAGVVHRWDGRIAGDAGVRFSF